MFQTGQEIGIYTLVKRIGRGGFGEVWLAERRAKFVTTKVAVKLPLEEQIDTEAVKSEAVLWEQASGHPNVLPIIDADEYDGQIVIVSEYAPDGSLEDLLQKGILPTRKAVELIIGILSGLEFLHSRKIIHRDIKPANILLQGETPRLADFGISRVMKTTNVSVNMSGTPSYMAPEAFDRKRTTQTDIWSVGVILYQMLKGSLPFPYSNITDLLGAIIMSEPESLPESVPENLRQIVLKALAKNLETRYSTAAEMRDDLANFLYSISGQNPMSNVVPQKIDQTFLPGQNVPTEIIEAQQNPDYNQSPTSFSAANQTQASLTFRGQLSVPETQPQEINPTPNSSEIRNINYLESNKPKPKKNLLIILAPLTVLFLSGILTIGYFGYQKFAFNPANKTDAQKNPIIKDSPPPIKISAQDMELLFKDVEPEKLKSMSEDPDGKKKAANNIRQLLAISEQARKDGMTDDPNVAAELENIRAETIANIYDKKINNGKTPVFSAITNNQIKEYLKKPTTEAGFQKYLDAKIFFAKENGSFAADKKLTDAEIKQAKDIYAKIKIYDEEYAAKKDQLGVSVNREVELQTELQQAQFLANRYAKNTLTPKAAVSDAEINEYIANHPEYSSKEKKNKAEQILSRVKAGEDFAKLAKEFSDDPGSKNTGGLYENVRQEQFEPTFESAALALEPGQISSDLVETKFGYHIIKLEKKGDGKDSSGKPTIIYTVRHILFSTMVKDPKDSKGPEITVAEFVKNKLEEDKQKTLIDEIVKNNPVEVAENFNIPQQPLKR